MQDRRRVFLKLLAAGPLLACSGNSGSPASFGDVEAGLVSGTSEGKLSLINGAPAVLARDAQGLYAMTTTCPHQGCDVSPSGNTLICPCHGSRFDSNGAVLNGPASSPLAHFAVSVDAGGNITVHGGMQVSSSIRTSVA
jgi:cytochrome b6-f complex iron-sulfur subunit